MPSLYSPAPAALTAPMLRLPPMFRFPPLHVCPRQFFMPRPMRHWLHLYVLRLPPPLRSCPRRFLSPSLCGTGCIYAPFATCAPFAPAARLPAPPLYAPAHAALATKIHASPLPPACPCPRRFFMPLCGGGGCTYAPFPPAAFACPCPCGYNYTCVGLYPRCFLASAACVCRCPCGTGCT